MTNQRIDHELMDQLMNYCDEFLIHAVDVEGKSKGIEKELTELIGSWGKIPITYAGGVHCFEDLDVLKELGRNCLNVTIGSSLDLFGGHMKWTDVMNKIKE
jgi:phosphoribosylformimino-5-aminoimidazole carboxamide ribotide isomerase